MFFKNALIYQSTKPLDYLFNSESPESLNEKLNMFKFEVCGALDGQKIGWDIPLPYGENLYHISDGYLLLRLHEQTKTIPSQLLNTMLAKEVTKTEESRGMKIGKVEKQSIKDAIIQKLLPQAFPKSSSTYGFISKKTGLVVIDTATSRKADQWTGLLRKTLGSLPVIPIQSNQPADVQMTSWLKDKETDLSPFKVGFNAQLVSALENGGKAIFRDRNLYSSEVEAALDNDMMVREIELLSEPFDFKLNDSFMMKSIKWDDSFITENDDVDIEDVLAKFDADFYLMASTLDDMLFNHFFSAVNITPVEDSL